MFEIVVCARAEVAIVAKTIRKRMGNSLRAGDWDILYCSCFLWSNSSARSRLSSNCEENTLLYPLNQLAIRPNPLQVVALEIRRWAQARGLGERLVDSPMGRLSAFEQVGIGIDPEGMTRHFQHGGIMHGVAKNSIGSSSDDFADCRCLTAPGRNPDQLLCRDPIFADDRRRDHVLFRNSKSARTCLDHPCIGRRDRPYFATVLNKQMD